MPKDKPIAGIAPSKLNKRRQDRIDDATHSTKASEVLDVDFKHQASLATGRYKLENPEDMSLLAINRMHEKADVFKNTTLFRILQNIEDPAHFSMKHLLTRCAEDYIIETYSSKLLDFNYNKIAMDNYKTIVRRSKALIASISRFREYIDAEPDLHFLGVDEKRLVRQIETYIRSMNDYIDSATPKKGRPNKSGARENVCYSAMNIWETTSGLPFMHDLRHTSGQFVSPAAYFVHIVVGAFETTTIDAATVKHSLEAALMRRKPAKCPNK